MCVLIDVAHRRRRRRLRVCRRRRRRRLRVCR